MAQLKMQNSFQLISPPSGVNRAESGAGQDGRDRVPDSLSSALFDIKTSMAKLGGESGEFNPKNFDFDTDQISKAILSYEKSLALGPDQEDVWTDLGVMYRRSNQPQKAVQCFDRALTIQADHQIALYNKGIVLIKDLDDRNGDLTAWQKLVQVNSQARTPRGDLVKDLLSKMKDSK